VQRISSSLASHAPLNPEWHWTIIDTVRQGLRLPGKAIAKCMDISARRASPSLRGRTSQWETTSTCPTFLGLLRLWATTIQESHTVGCLFNVLATSGPVSCPFGRFQLMFGHRLSCDPHASCRWSTNGHYEIISRTGCRAQPAVPQVCAPDE